MDNEKVKNCCENCGGCAEEQVLNEELVHVEINGIFQNLFSSESSDDLSSISKFVGLDTEQPIVQIGNQVFAGSFEDTLGTSLFFTITDNQSPDSDSEEGLFPEKVFDNSASKKAEYACKSSKKLVLKRVFLTPKK